MTAENTVPNAPYGFAGIRPSLQGICEKYGLKQKLPLLPGKLRIPDTGVKTCAIRHQVHSVPSPMSKQADSAGSPAQALHSAEMITTSPSIHGCALPLIFPPSCRRIHPL